MQKLSSLAMAMTAAVVLMATPALAQNAPPAAAPPAATQGGDMQGMKMAKPAKKHMAKHASMKGGKLTCMDYAWQSQDEKDCEAGSKKPPMGRS